MTNLLRFLSGVDIAASFGLLAGTAETVSDVGSPQQPYPAEAMPSVLPFSHPVLDQHLADVRLQSNGVLSESSTSGKIFQELAHWHNAKSPLDPKHVAKPPKGKYAYKKVQMLMSDTIAYSASLTGASGKTIDPETIIVDTSTAKPRTAATGPHSTRDKEREIAHRMKKEVPKSNKQKALEHGQARRLEKQATVSQSVVAGWKDRCLEFEMQTSMVKRYLRAERYSSALSSSHREVVGAEVLLYLGDVLLRMQSSSGTPKSSGEHPLTSCVFQVPDLTICVLKFPLSLP